MDARCAFHQNQEATFTCDRCGNFGCELCRSLTKGTRCAACYVRSQEEVRVAAPVVGLDFHQALRESLQIPWSHRLVVLLLAALPAIPAAYVQVLTDHIVSEVWPGATPPETIKQADIDRFMDVAASHQGALVSAWVASALLGVLMITVCTALFASAETRREGVVGLAMRRFVPALLTSLVVGLALTAATMACCLPVIPASGALIAAVPATVLAGKSPFAAMRASYEKVLPQLWVVVGVELMLWSLALGAGIVTGSVIRPLQLALGDHGLLIGAGLGAYVSAVLETTRVALGVIVFEKLKPSPPA